MVYTRVYVKTSTDYDNIETFQRHLQCIHNVQRRFKDIFCASITYKKTSQRHLLCIHNVQKDVTKTSFIRFVGVCKVIIWAPVRKQFYAIIAKGSFQRDAKMLAYMMFYTYATINPYSVDRYINYLLVFVDCYLCHCHILLQ